MADSLMYLPVNPIDGVAGAKEPAIAPISFVNQRITTCSTAHHVVEVEDAAFRSRLRLAEKVVLLRTKQDIPVGCAIHPVFKKM